MWNKIKDYFSIILGAIIITLYVWNRFIKESSFDDIKYTLILFSILCSLLLTTKSLYLLFNKNKIALKNNFLIKIIAYYTDFITKTPIKVYEIIYLWKYFPVKQLIEIPISHITAYLYYPKSLYPKLISILLLQMPKAVVATTFLFDTLYLNQLFYFTKVLWLLSLLLIIKMFLYLSYHHSKKNIEFFDLYIEFFKTEINPQVFVRYRNSLPNIENPIDVNKVQLSTIAGWYTIYANIRNFIKTIYDFNDKINIYFTLYVSICFLIGWSYYLFIFFK